MPRHSGKTRTLTAVGVLAALGVAWWVWPHRWEIEGASPAVRCVISEGMSAATVATQCGEPLARGGQPKLMEGLSTICSAPCELYSEHVVFHDCKGGVYRVAGRSSAQGCVFEGGQQP